MKYKKILCFLTLLCSTSVSLAHNKLIPITPELKDLLYSLEEDFGEYSCSKLKAICNHITHGGVYLPANILDKTIEELVTLNQSEDSSIKNINRPLLKL